MKIKEVAKMLDLSVNTVRELAKNGQIPCMMFERTHRTIYRFNRDKIEALAMNDSQQSTERVYSLI